MPTLPTHPPFALRARLLTPLGAGGFRYERDARIEVDAAGNLAQVAAWNGRDAAVDASVDVRPMVILPGMVDLHLHLPQLPNAGLGAGLDLLTWLDRYIFPLERDFDRNAAERLAPAAFRAMAAAGTTTALMYGAVFETSLDAAFEAAEAHGIRAVIVDEPLQPLGAILHGRHLGGRFQSPPMRFDQRSVRKAGGVTEP